MNRFRLLVLTTIAAVAFSASPATAPKPVADEGRPAANAATSAAPLDGAAHAAATHGWIDLLRNPALSDWERCPLPPGSTLEARSPWHFDAASGILRCDGTGFHELFLHRSERGDGIFHVEWRYTGSPAKPNSGIVVRAKPDGTVSFQADLAPANAGTLFGATPSGPGGRVVRSTSGKRRPELLKQSGHWNATELVCMGPRVILHLNGTATAELRDTSAAKGLLGLKADDTPIEFRNLRFKPLP